jgi:hypothetical protein
VLILLQLKRGSNMLLLLHLKERQRIASSPSAESVLPKGGFASSLSAETLSAAGEAFHFFG